VNKDKEVEKKILIIKKRIIRMRQINMRNIGIELIILIINIIKNIDIVVELLLIL
jgi:hypothetical protein